MTMTATATMTEPSATQTVAWCILTGAPVPAEGLTAVQVAVVGRWVRWGQYAAAALAAYVAAVALI
ncbi:hypothetical protein [Cellulomonas sp. KRMCY2]|uniref:hypothetical protein n=1 Tax=Cellulomonas sp. KRMCY2 TaxID=1304865 RepID=UPI00045EC4E3|nr:hypothetical protein [Cellulomonas sp. KRMCY2]